MSLSPFGMIDSECCRSRKKSSSKKFQQSRKIGTSTTPTSGPNALSPFRLKVGLPRKNPLIAGPNPKLTKCALMLLPPRLRAAGRRRIWLRLLTANMPVPAHQLSRTGAVPMPGAPLLPHIHVLPSSRIRWKVDIRVAEWRPLEHGRRVRVAARVHASICFVEYPVECAAVLLHDDR